MADALGTGVYGRVHVHEHDKTLCVKSFDKDENARRELMLVNHFQDLFDLASKEVHIFANARVAYPLERHVIDGELHVPRIIMHRHGVTLASVISHSGPLPTDDLQSLQRSLVSGLSFLNFDARVVWCDPKPSNILRSRDGVGWVIADFSLWRVNVTSAPISCAYALEMRSPELLMGDSTVALWLSDWWAVGLCIEYADRGGLPYGVCMSPAQVLNAYLRSYCGRSSPPIPQDMTRRLRALGLGDVKPANARPISPRRSLYIGLLVFDPSKRRKAVERFVGDNGERCPPVGLALQCGVVLEYNLLGATHALRTKHADALVAAGVRHSLPCRLVIAALSVVDAALHRALDLAVAYGDALPSAALFYADVMLIEDTNGEEINKIATEVQESVAEDGVVMSIDSVLCCMQMLGNTLDEGLPFGVSTWLFHSLNAVVHQHRDPATFYSQYYQYIV